MSQDKGMVFRPRQASHTVRVTVDHAPARPLPHAEHGTTWIMTQVTAEWYRSGADPWRLHVVTATGAASNGDQVTRDYWLSNMSKQPPKELSAWIASTHPEVSKGQST